MKKNVILQIVQLILVVLSIIFTTGCQYGWDRFARERQELADELGVNMSAYPEFPIDYFSSVLKPGMSKEAAHQIVKGYKAVYLCNMKSDLPTEFYYFITADEYTSDRILVWYDKNGTLDHTTIEDPDSRSLQNYVSDCIPGRLGN
jgi:hypothetical protein